MRSQTTFEADPYPGRPKILFIGASESSHTHAWIDLLKESEFNVRLFALPTGVPPESWWVKTYITMYRQPPSDSDRRVGLFNKGAPGRLIERSIARLRKTTWTGEGKICEWLARIINQWQPDIVHTLGLDPASYLYSCVSKSAGAERKVKWVAQVRGGPDLALHRLLPEFESRIRSVLTQCDKLIADNPQNYDYARELGLRDEQLSELGPVPGTGGINVDSLAGRWQGRPSQRSIIVWPKAYECPQSTALPVLEAFRIAWPRLPACEVHMLATQSVQPTVRMWFQTLPDHVREHCHLRDRISREETLQLFTGARVMLAPALADGVPNSLYEAMAAGAFPIVSPLDTIRNVVAEEQNVLFARNLYPEEIAAALVRGMNDDALVDDAAQRNLALVQRIANRTEVQPRVVKFYESVAGQAEHQMPASDPGIG
jgi:glycosyltransferase involved in cell wall biosynthesis